MNALNFPIGEKTFDVNDGAAQISFNPTDVNFVSALYDLFAECAERYETDKDKKFENNTAFFEYVRQRDAEVSDGVDRLFGEGAAAVRPWNTSRSTLLLRTSASLTSRASTPSM